jgi:hypothetical protein
MRKAILGFAAVVAIGAAGVAGAAQASTVVSANCLNVTDTHGCLFSGNINSSPHDGGGNGYKDAEDAYNLFNNTHPLANPDITLTLLGDTDDAGFGAIGTFTGAGTTSGTWSLPGLNVGFVAVKAGPQFVLYELGSAASSGSWNTFDLLVGNGNHPAISHLEFFGPDVVINPTGGGAPEPATWAMLLLGFFGLGSLIRFRRFGLAPA